VLFNGTNSYVALPYSYTLGMLGDFTAMAWVNPANANGSLPVFGTDSTTPDQGLQLMVQGGKVYFGFYADDSVGVGAITNNGWQHIVWRYHNGEQAIFINGQLDSFDGGHAPFGGLAPVLIGRSSVGLGSTNNLNSARYFNGLIDDAQIYGRALTDVEILYQYQHPAMRTPTAWPSSGGQQGAVVSAGPIRWSITPTHRRPVGLCQRRRQPESALAGHLALDQSERPWHGDFWQRGPDQHHRHI